MLEAGVQTECLCSPSPPQWTYRISVQQSEHCLFLLCVVALCQPRISFKQPPTCCFLHTLSLSLSLSAMMLYIHVSGSSAPSMWRRRSNVQKFLFPLWSQSWSLLYQRHSRHAAGQQKIQTCDGLRFTSWTQMRSSGLDWRLLTAAPRLTSSI